MLRPNNAYASTCSLIILLLSGLWLYTVGDKVYHFDAYQQSMMRQVFTRPIAIILVYTLPVVEWLAFCLLIFPKYRRAGLYLSAILLLAFSGYVLFAVMGFYPKRPCSCGGLFRKLSWKAHLILNCCLSTMNVCGLLLFHFKRKEVQDN